MSSSFLQKYIIFALSSIIIILSLPFFVSTPKPQKVYAATPIQHVFIIMMENHNWNQIKGSASAPYINKALLPMGGHAEQYYNPPGNHPSEPNYIWLEAGTNFGINNDNNPSSNNISSTNHLVTLLKNNGISWKAYQEDIPGTNCPINNTGNYAVRHAPFVFFNDVSGKPPSISNSYCQSHYIPFTKLASDLASNSVASYNFITPDECHDMHSNFCNAFGTSDLVKQGDTWLSQEVPMILNSQVFKTSGALFIIWDEGEGGDGPIGMIVESPFAKKHYSNTIHYDHGSTLKTVEEILGVSPMLGGAAKATDLSDFFTGGLSGSSGTTHPTPTDITPTLFCLGSCQTSPSPSGATGGGSGSGSGGNGTTPAQTSPGVSESPSVSPSQSPCNNKGGDNDDDKDNKKHKSKKHHKSHKGGLSKLLLQILQLLINLINQLLRSSSKITLQSTTAPCTSFTPSTAPSNSPSVSTSA